MLNINECTENVKKVFNIFNNFFGQENVDFQESNNNINILVYFPEITVTNELENSHKILDVYVKIAINNNGVLQRKFKITRSTYTIQEVVANYCHSHIQNIRLAFEDCFNIPCLGTGPIAHTVYNLENNFSESIWELFCYELKLYLETESLVGIPYRKMANIPENITGEFSKINYNSQNFYINKDDTFNKILGRFIHFCLQKDLPLCYNGNAVEILGSALKKSVLMTNLFIEFLNSTQLTGLITPNVINNLFTTVYIKDKEIYRIKGDFSFFGESTKEDFIYIYEDTPLFIFKDSVVRAHFIENLQEADSLIPYKFLKKNVVFYLLSELEKVLNLLLSSNGSEYFTISSKTRLV